MRVAAFSLWRMAAAAEAAADLRVANADLSLEHKHDAKVGSGFRVQGLGFRVQDLGGYEP